MLSLEHLPPPPSITKVTACENDGQLRAYAQPEADHAIHHWLGNYNVEVTISQESARPAYSKCEAKEAFFTHTETVWQRLVAAYYEEGTLAAIRQLSLEDEDIYPIFRKCSSYILKVIKRLEVAKSYLPSQSRTSSMCTLDTSLQAMSGAIVCIAWHPHTSTLAAVFADDTIRVFGKGRSLTPLLKHRLQKNVTYIEWMPFCASILAVGCESGVLLWTLDPVSVVTRPSGSCLTHLAHPSTLPTSSLSWHPKGLTLACVGDKGRELVLWDIAREEPSVAYSGVASCINMVNWSPDGNRLLASMSSATIKVFECRTWSFEQWSLEHPLQSAVWSQCGRLLLFVTRKDPFIYCLSFSEGEGVCGAQLATQVADLSAILSPSEDGEETRVGGHVKQIAWDPKSERLAVLFKESELIALFHTYTHPQLHLAPGGFIRGEVGQVPLQVTFQKNVSNGAILTIVWSGGKVKHIPLHYTSHEPLNAKLNASLRLFNQSALTSPVINQSMYLNVTLGPTSPLTSPLSRLFTSPS